MSLLTKFSNGWSLAKSSLGLLNDNKSLLLFPILSGVALLFVLSTFFGGGYFLIGDEVEAIFEDNNRSDMIALGMIFIYYLISFTIITFFNASLIHCTTKILNGEETNLQDGISFSMSRIGKIISWAVISATVGVILQIIQNTGKIGEIISSLIGMAWSVVTFFVVPILIYEDIGVFDSIKSSTQLIKQKWGESLSGNFSFGLMYVIGLFAAIAIGVLFSMVNPILGTGVVITLILTLAIIFSAAKNVLVAVIYNHVNDKPSASFNTDVLDDIFVNK